MSKIPFQIMKFNFKISILEPLESLLGGLPLDTIFWDQISPLNRNPKIKMCFWWKINKNSA